MPHFHTVLDQVHGVYRPVGGDCHGSFGIAWAVVWGAECCQEPTLWAKLLDPIVVAVGHVERAVPSGATATSIG